MITERTSIGEAAMKAASRWCVHRSLSQRCDNSKQSAVLLKLRRPGDCQMRTRCAFGKAKKVVRLLYHLFPSRRFPPIASSRATRNRPLPIALVSPKRQFASKAKYRPCLAARRAYGMVERLRELFAGEAA